jgi:glycerophosphoryl diester phosphodiesterase
MTSLWLVPNRTPLIVGHRGSSALAPENTLASFRQSIVDNADAVELDVRLTKDDEVVVIHDGSLARTTDGRGNAGKKSLAELKKLDAGSWFNREHAAEKIPTLKEVLALLRGKMGIDIEIKSEPHRMGNNEIVDRCCEIVKDLDMIGDVLVSSFNVKFLERAKQIDERLVLGFLYEPSRQIKSGLTLVKKIGAQYLILHKRNIGRKMVFDAHNSNILVGEYPVDTHVRFERSVRYGVDAVFSNNPALLRKPDHGK